MESLIPTDPQQTSALELKCQHDSTTISMESPLSWTMGSLKGSF